MNRGAMFSSKTDLWETPQDFFDKLNEEFHSRLMSALCRKTPSANTFTAQSRTVLFKSGAEPVGAIRLMEGRSASGCEKHPNPKPQPLC